VKIPKLLLVLLFCLMIVQAADAEVFRYFDEEGTLIVTDNPFGTKKRDRLQYLKQQNRNNKVRLNFWEEVAYEFYEVSGKTIYDAIAATDRVGPFDPREGRHYAGQTRWNFGLSYDLDFSYQFSGDSIRVSAQIHNIGFRSDIIPQSAICNGQEAGFGGPFASFSLRMSLSSVMNSLMSLNDRYTEAKRT